MSLEKRAEAKDAQPLIEIVRADSIEPQPIEWLWPGWLARGKLHILAGKPGTGKTTLALDLAAAFSRAGRWPDGVRAPTGHVLIWSGEDGIADTIVPRLMAAGANLGNVSFPTTSYVEGEPRPFDPARDVDELEAAAARIGRIGLIVADPVINAVTGDAHKNADVRRSLQPLVDLASRMNAAVIGITHFSKGTAGHDPLERVTGSIAFGAMARVVLVASTQEEGDRLVARAKSNIGPDGGGFTYKLEQTAVNERIEASRVVWTGSVEGTAFELLGKAEQQEDAAGTDAADFLRELLKDGPRPARTILNDAVEAGFSKTGMHRARQRLGVKTMKEGMGGGWYWRLGEDSPPKNAESSESSQPSESSGNDGNPVRGEA